MLKSILQGKAFGHPLHPMIVHMPIGLFALSVVLDVASFFGGVQPIAFRASFYALLFGVVTALLAAVPGLVDYLDIRADHPGRKTATIHMILNIIAVVIFAGSLALRWRGFDDVRVPTIPFALSLIGMSIIFYSGYLGGALVYDHGIGVGRHRRESETPDRTIEINSPDEFVAIADESALPEGQTLRASVNGVVIAIARSGGKLYAFQEFCTHRFGPLSEGALLNDTVQCPWHRSCFNMSSGEVVNGPAKVKLKTFEAQVREGKITVRMVTSAA